MSSKDINQKLETLFVDHKEDLLSFEKVAEVLGKMPTASQVKKIRELCQKYQTKLVSSSELAKTLNTKDRIRQAQERKKLLDEELDSEFDLMKERELLEWSRSDSPVRMYLREMGQIELLTKDDEVELSKQIELGENIILDAICSVPYLIDFIYDYREALINRERRVKELFKSFDDGEDGESNDDESDDDEGEEDGKKAISKKDQKRVEKVLESFIIDNLKGLSDAFKTSFPDVKIQKCVIHQIRNSLRYVSPSDSNAFASDMKKIYKSTSYDNALKALDDFEEK